MCTVEEPIEGTFRCGHKGKDIQTNAEAMAILCDMWHLKSGRVPISDISSDTLYEIALLVDKYDSVESIQLWPKLW